MNNLFKFRMLGLYPERRPIFRALIIVVCNWWARAVLPERNGENAPRSGWKLEMLSISMIYADFYHGGRKTMINPKINKCCKGKNAHGSAALASSAVFILNCSNPTYLYDSRLFAQVLRNNFRLPCQRRKRNPFFSLPPNYSICFHQSGIATVFIWNCIWFAFFSASSYTRISSSWWNVSATLLALRFRSFARAARLALLEQQKPWRLSWSQTFKGKDFRWLNPFSLQFSRCRRYYATYYYFASFLLGSAFRPQEFGCSCP